MTNAGFYLLGKRAFHTLKYFCDHIGSASVGFVVCGTDAGVDDDFFDEIRGLCEDKSIQFFTRKQAESAELPHVSVRYAIGWRWVIRETHKLIILHDSLLPKFRGFCPLVNMLIEGEHEIGVTAIFASRDYDRGEIIDNRCVRINYPKKIKAAIEEVMA